MKKIYISKLIMVVVLLGTSCTKDFEEINTNPNNPDTAPLESVLAYNIIELSDRFSIDEEMEYAASYVGHITMGQNNEKQRYLEIPPDNMWKQYYVRNLTNLNGLINDASIEEANVKAAALLLKAYATVIQVDAFGSIPYSEAGKLDEGYSQPKFDSEEDIYFDLLDILKQANDLFSNNLNDLGKGDLIYGAKANGMRINAWKKFANSLRLRLAMRISNVREDKTIEVFNEILNDPSQYPIFEENDDSAILVFPGGDWLEPWAGRSGYKPYIKIAAPIVDTLKRLSDPRLVEYVSGPNDAGDIIGLQVGDYTSQISSGFVSYEVEVGVNTQFTKNVIDGKVFFMTYSEVEFLKAEAYARGYVGAVTDAELSYEAGITANMKFYGISDSEIKTYLEQSSIDYNNDVNKIYLQKWISLFRQSWEAWAEMRRTNIPNLPIAKNANYTNHNVVPYRFSYPVAEKNLNGANFPTDVISEDFYWGTPIWWDTRHGIH